MKQVIRYIFCTFLVLNLTACGSKPAKLAEPDLRVVLQTPEGSNPEMFWHGVTEKSFLWLEQGAIDPVKISMEQIEGFNFPTDRGGTLQFKGVGDHSEPLVEGQVNMDANAQHALIKLHRCID